MPEIETFKIKGITITKNQLLVLRHIRDNYNEIDGYGVIRIIWGEGVQSRRYRMPAGNFMKRLEGMGLVRWTTKDVGFYRKGIVHYTLTPKGKTFIKNV